MRLGFERRPTSHFGQLEQVADRACHPIDAARARAPPQQPVDMALTLARIGGTCADSADRLPVDIVDGSTAALALGTTEPSTPTTEGGRRELDRHPHAIHQDSALGRAQLDLRLVGKREVAGEARCKCAEPTDLPHVQHGEPFEAPPKPAPTGPQPAHQPSATGRFFEIIWQSTQAGPSKRQSDAFGRHLRARQIASRLGQPSFDIAFGDFRQAFNGACLGGALRILRTSKGCADAGRSKSHGQHRSVATGMRTVRLEACDASPRVEWTNRITASAPRLARQRASYRARHPCSACRPE